MVIRFFHTLFAQHVSTYISLLFDRKVLAAELWTTFQQKTDKTVSVNEGKVSKYVGLSGSKKLR
jgi:hypothetical protein